jgi:hypothetical protein
MSVWKSNYIFFSEMLRILSIPLMHVWPVDQLLLNYIKGDPRKETQHFLKDENQRILMR